MNVAKLERVAERILAEPTLFEMELFFSRKHDKNFNWCGTAACIAGHALLETGKVFIDTNGDIRHAVNIVFSYAVVAQEELGLTDNQSRMLFYVDNWPIKFLLQYYGCDEEGEPCGKFSLEKRAQVAADAIRDFIATGGWPNAD